jgi:3',5'-cyclic AMP phosphodiesterase CpdA
MLEWERTIHGIGDLHAGSITPARLAKVLDDVKSLGGAPALHLQVGDVTESGASREDRIAKGWLDQLPGEYEVILGNHDIAKNRRSAEQWATVWGYPSKNHVIDLDFVRIIAVGPDRLEGPQKKAARLSKATLDWLEARLEDAPGDCWIACHWPPYGTVLGDPKRYYHSKLPTFHAKPHEPIRSLLARHANAKAWLSGHTHSPIWATRLVCRFGLPRGRWILAINLSALAYIGKKFQTGDPLCSLYLTHHDDRIDVRYRNHADRYWGAMDGPGVLSCGIPDD